MENFHRKEILRHNNNVGDKGVWLRTSFEKWILLPNKEVNWFCDCEYVVNDDQAELRKLQMDYPDTKFEVYLNSRLGWVFTVPVFWDPSFKYRIQEEGYTYQWIYQDEEYNWVISYKFYPENPEFGYGECLAFQHTRKKVKV